MLELHIETYILNNGEKYLSNGCVLETLKIL